MDTRQWQIRHSRASFCQGHIPLQPSQSDGVMKTGWTITQPSALPAGSITLMGPRVLPEKHSVVSGRNDTTKPQELSFSSCLLGFIPPVGFASRWQATPGRAPGQPAWATELLHPIQTAERSPPSSPAPSPVMPIPAPAPVPALSQTTRPGGCRTLWGSLQPSRWTEKSWCSAECAWRCSVPIPAIRRREMHSATAWPFSPEKHFYVTI